MGGSDANSRVLRVVGSRGGDEMDGRCNAWIRQIKEFVVLNLFLVLLGVNEPS